VRRIAVIAAVLAATAACGGSGHSGNYAKEATSACLTGKGVSVVSVAPSTDFVADSATGGAFRARLPHNRVTVSFGLTLDDADNINQAYRRFHAANVGIDDILRQQGNAVMLWHTHPSNADIATVTGCLKS
jgi:hypothetical protein